MPFAVVLDTCVFYPAHLRDTLLRLAERGLYRALWSAGIVDELHRNLVEDGRNAVSVDRLIAEMAAAFPDAEVAGYRSLIDGLSCRGMRVQVEQPAAGVADDPARVVSTSDHLDRARQRCVHHRVQLGRVSRCSRRLDHIDRLVHVAAVRVGCAPPVQIGPCPNERKDGVRQCGHDDPNGTRRARRGPVVVSTCGSVGVPVRGLSTLRRDRSSAEPTLAGRGGR